MITREQLLAIMPRAGVRSALFLEPLNMAMAQFEILTPGREAAFLAQLGHESQDLTRLDENLNYSAERLCQVWPRRFPSLEAALPFAHKPIALAERVYGGRMGNGPQGSGDGYRYHGRGPIQVTGKDMYRDCGAALGLALIADPDKLIEPGPGARSAGWVWRFKGCNELADVEDFELITRRINGGRGGYDDRLARWGTAKDVLA